MEILFKIEVKVKLNGREVIASVSPEESLLDFLRNRVHAIEVKCGCNMGDCGVCTVIFEGKAVKSCLILAAQLNNKEVWTLKGLEQDEMMQELQESFARHGAVQCGFCTPGMLVAARNFLVQTGNPGRSQIKEALAGNLCRCTGYKKIIDAVAAVADRRKFVEA